MTVYVDDMHTEDMGRLNRMKCSHMIADSDEELHAMAAKIGMRREWHQTPGPRSHYDVAKGRRAKAVELGSVQITMRQCAMMCRRRAVTGSLGSPDDAARWFAEWSSNRSAAA